MTTYSLYITDGTYRNAGGETTIEAASLDDARAAWVAWAQDGDYTTSEGGEVRVDGSIWVGEECLTRVHTMATAMKASD
jgi:hypothetical protein